MLKNFARMVLVGAVVSWCGMAARAAEVVKGVELAGGLVMTLGQTDGSREIELAGKGRFLVVHVATDAQAATALRNKIAEQGMTGVVTVVESLEKGKLPFVDEIVTLAVMEGAGPAEAELLRVLRPGGVARVQTGKDARQVVKPWPKDYASWSHYQRDASFNEVTPDRGVGMPSGFQWVADTIDPNARRPDTISIRVADGISVSADRVSNRPMLVARDAFNGIELWSTLISEPKPKRYSEGEPLNPYTFLIADGRVYVHATYGDHGRSFDLRTGKELTVFDQGLPLFTDYKWATPGKEMARRDFVHQGVLFQVYGENVCALDFTTGKRLWQVTQPEGKGWDRPAAEGDVLVVAEGKRPKVEGARKLSGYIRGWSIEVEALVGLSIKDGKQLWRTPLPKADYALDNCIRDGRYFLSMINEMRGTEPHAEPRKPIPTVCVSVKDGKLLWQRDMAWGGGHPPHLMATENALWQTSHGGGVGVALDGKGDFIRRDTLNVSTLFALWGCNTTWMSESSFYSRLSVTDMKTGRVRANTAVRSACVFGTTPAHGLLYSTPHACGCHGTVNGYTAVHSRDLREFKTPWNGQRLIAGQGKRAVNGALARPAADEWAVYLRDSARTSWVETQLEKEPKQAWAVAMPQSSAPDWLKRVWGASTTMPGPVTALTVAEGIVAGAYVDQHTVFALDAATGKQRWKAVLDSAIDSPPTIHNGAVYVGTRGGWLWALGRDDGAVIWRFLAAPHVRHLVVNGRIESTWPLFGTVALHEGRLWVSAGRSVELDQGLFWWSLEPATGAVRSSGRIHDDSEWLDTTDREKKTQRLLGINSPLAINGDFAMLAPMAFRPSDGSLLRPYKDYSSSQYDSKNAMKTPVPVPGMYGLVYDGRTNAGRTGSYMVYGSVGGRLLAYRGDNFVGVQAGLPGARGGGGTHVGRFRRLPEETLPFAKRSEPVWSLQVLQGREDVSTGLVVAGETIATAFSRKGSWLTLYNYADGSVLSETSMPTTPVFGGLSAAKGTLYMAGRNGTIYAYR